MPYITINKLETVHILVVFLSSSSSSLVLQGERPLTLMLVERMK